MSNRPKPKTWRREDCPPRVMHLGAGVREALTPLRCPDCDSEFGPLMVDQAGVMRLQLQHDETCPWMARRSA